MPFEVKYDEQAGYISSVFTGRVTMKVVREYIAELLPLLEQTGCKRLLSDSRSADIHFSALDIMQFPKIAAASPLTQNLKRAVVATPGTSGYEMYETMSIMQGQDVKAFVDFDEAVTWLLNDQD